MTKIPEQWGHVFDSRRQRDDEKPRRKAFRQKIKEVE